MRIVMKFGGTSVGSAQAIRETVSLIGRYQEAGHSVVIVASGMGTKPVKVTDMLLNGANAALNGDAGTFHPGRWAASGSFGRH